MLCVIYQLPANFPRNAQSNLLFHVQLYICLLCRNVGHFSEPLLSLITLSLINDQAFLWCGRLFFALLCLLNAA